MAKRISLREFQQSLSERLVSARRGEGATPCSASSPAPTIFPAAATG
jgi:hypothetical protein